MGLLQQLLRPYADFANIINLSSLLKYCSNVAFSAHGFVEKIILFEEIPEHGIFHGITI